MISDKFRRQLRSEAKLWQAEGLINAPLYEQLSDRYQFDSLETASRNRFLAILIGLGGILLGLGAITFVAANWQEWPREFRVVLLLSVFVGVNAGGFYLWRTPLSNSREQMGWQKRLGQGLLLLGALSLGANMALMAQMFHIGGSPYGLYLVWGLGVLAMAYSLRLTSLGVVAILLMGLGYWLGIFEWWSSKEEFSWLDILVQHFPLVAGLMFVPLAYWCRSRAIFTLAAIAIVFSLEVSISQGLKGGWGFAIASVLPPALLWGYDDLILPQAHSRLFQSIARTLALLFLASLFYITSFHGLWDSFPNSIQDKTVIDWIRLLDVAFLAGLTVFEWLRLGRQERKRPQRQGVDLTTNAIAAFLAITALTHLWNLTFTPIPILATFIFNVLLFLLAVGLIREGLAIGNRATFWGGIVLIALQIISRLFEYNTELLLKSFVFALCGIGIIAAGFWYEKHFAKLKKQEEMRM